MWLVRSDLLSGNRTLRSEPTNASMTAMKKWWMIVLIVVLFIGGLAWKLLDVGNCTDNGGVVITPLTGHQECVKR